MKEKKYHKKVLGRFFDLTSDREEHDIDKVIQDLERAVGQLREANSRLDVLESLILYAVGLGEQIFLVEEKLKGREHQLAELKSRLKYISSNLKNKIKSLESI